MSVSWPSARFIRRKALSSLYFSRKNRRSIACCQPSRNQSTKATPVIKFVRPYTTDFVGWLRDFGVGSANYDANGHFSRISPIFNAYSFNQNTSQLTPVPPSQRLAGLQTNQIRRCPGAASQAPVDGSAPFRDADGSLDCDPSLLPPGP